MSKSITILSAAKTEGKEGVTMVIKRSWKTGTAVFACEPLSCFVDALIILMVSEELKEIIFTPRAVKNLDDLLCFARLGGQK